MTEKEKVKQGLVYNPNYDKELIEERKKAKDLCFKYNNILPSQYKEKKQIIKELFKSTKQEFLIEQNFWCDYGYNITIGENFYMNHNCVILDCAEVKFGDNVFVAPNCGFYTAGHPIEADKRNEGLEYAKSINIGNNVWIGGNVTILPGTSIGENTVIGAGSVVTKNIPSNVIAVGNPCKVIKNIK